MPYRSIMLALLLSLPLGAVSHADEGDIAKVKEQELEEVRERISVLKQSMDQSALERDRLTGELQDLEVRIAEARLLFARWRDAASAAEAARNEAKSADEKVATAQAAAKKGSDRTR